MIIPLFDGKRENFDIFLLRLKTASMSTGLDSMLHKGPREIEEQIQAAKAKISSTKTRSDSADEFQELAQKVHILIGFFSKRESQIGLWAPMN